jgi:hypothetical protein
MNLSKTKISALFIILLAGLLLAGATNAQVANIPGVQAVGPTSVGGIVDIIRAIVRWVYIIFFILAVLFILFAAFSYLFSAGDPEKVATAKNRIIYAAIAVAVAFLAVGFETIIRIFLTAPTA